MIKPLNGNLVLKKELKENKTESGILLSQKKKEEEYAVVVEICKDETELKIGDKVIYKTYDATNVKYENEEYLIISKKDILAVIK